MGILEKHWVRWRRGGRGGTRGIASGSMLMKRQARPLHKAKSKASQRTPQCLLQVSPAGAGPVAR
jgi:hypothetical protein